MAEAPHLVRTGDPEAAAADLLTQALRAGLRESAWVRLAVPGRASLAPLRAVRETLGPRFARVRLTWVDERRVPFATRDSNRGEAWRRGILDPAQPPELELPLFLDGEGGEDAAARVRAQLRTHFADRLDVLLLGMGPDGHIASLFPDRPLPEDPTVALVERSPKPPPRRITLTPPILRTARRSLLLVTGAEKRGAVRRVLAGDPALVASHLPELVVVTDLCGTAA